MASTGLFRLIVIFGLAVSSALAAQPDPLSSPSWIRAQKVKRSDAIVELSHLVDDNPDPNAFHQGGTGFRHGTAPPHLSGGITLSGPAHRLSNFHEVTSSWKIVGCTNKHKRKQVVLAYCVGANPKTDCAGIFVGGARNTIIQLPTGCGASPFGHVVKFAPTNRKLPLTEAKSIGKKDFSVYELVFDYKFTSIPYKKGDPVIGMHMEFSNKLKTTKKKNFGKPRSYHKWFANLNEELYQKDNSIPINHDFSTSLASVSQQCNGFAMSLDMNAQGNINGSITYGYYVKGTIMPPAINDHYMYMNANSFVTTNVDLTGMIKYTFTALSIPVVPSIGLPGLDYPGLLTIGPYFEINAVLSGELAVAGKVTINSGFSIPTVDISFGNGTEPKSNSDAINFADVILSDNVKVGAGITFALTPQIGLGLKVFNNVVDADVSLQPSAGITAGGSGNFNTKTGDLKNPCIELDGSLNLNWGVGGKLGPWGSAVTGRIWGIQKTLWQKCFDKRKRAIESQGKWQKVHGRSSSPSPSMKQHPNNFAIAIICPAINPFGDGNNPSPP